MKAETRNRLLLGLVLAVVVTLLVLSGLGGDDDNGGRTTGHAVAHPDGLRSLDESWLARPEPDAPQPLPQHTVPTPASVPDGCEDVLGQFLSIVRELHACRDAPPQAGGDVPGLDVLLAHEVPIPEEYLLAAPSMEGFAVFIELAKARGDYPPTESPYVVEFRRLERCALDTGLESSLRDLVVATFVAETHVGLKQLWFDMLGFFEPCAAGVLTAVREHMYGALAGTHPPLAGGLKPYRSYLLRARSCQVEPPILVDLLRLLEAIESETARTAFMLMLAAYFPYDEAMGQLIADGIRTSEHAWSSVELLYFYASQELDAHQIRALLERDPRAFDALLAGDVGGQAAWAVYKLLVQYGGSWGSDVITALVLDPPEGANPAELLGFLAQSEDAGFDWRFFEQFLDGEDPELVLVAWQGLGARARHNDAAYVFLQGELGNFSAPVRQRMAVRGISMSGREDAADVLWDAVLAIPSDAELTREAIHAYAHQDGADVEALKTFADYRTEPDPNTRRVAALNILSATQDLDASAPFVEALMSDPELGMEASIATGIYLQHVKGDTESLARWEQIKPFGHDLKLAVGELYQGATIEQYLGRFASDQFAGELSAKQVMASVAEAQGHPTAGFVEARNWLDSQLRLAAKAMQKKDASD